MSKFRSIELSDPRFESDHLRLITVKSQALKGRGDITVFLPPGLEGAANLPLVILLHGVFGSHWAWTGMGGVHQTALGLIDAKKIKPMVIAMPSDGLWGDGSAYLPHEILNFEKWIMEDVVGAVTECIPSVGEKSPLFISGLSMGGYGALRLGAKYPGRFKAFSGHSSLTDLSQLGRFLEDKLDPILPGSGVECSVLKLMVENRKLLPPFRFDCGIKDPLIGVNREFDKRLQELGIPHQYQEFSGDHNWEYWREHISDTLHFFNGQN